MAAEYRPDLRAPVDILINGPIEARLAVIQPQESSWASRLTNWVSTPFRMWLTGQHLSLDTPPVGRPPSRLAAEEGARLGEEVYILYETIARRHKAYSLDPQKGQFVTDIPLGPDERPLDLKIQEDEEGRIAVILSKQTLKATEITLMRLKPDGLVRSLRTILYDSEAPPNVKPEIKNLGSYSPIQDLLALKTVGEFTKQKQWAMIVDEDPDHLFDE